jgi:hypothetical protein
LTGFLIYAKIKIENENKFKEDKMSSSRKERILRELDGNNCQISTFETNLEIDGLPIKAETPFLNMDGHIVDIIVTNLPENKIFKAKLIEKNGSFVSVRINDNPMTIELAK